MQEEKRQLRCRAIIEMLGKPREYIVETLKKYVKDIKENPEIIILNEDYAEPRQQETMFSVFVELEMVVKDVNTLVGFCIDYMPSSVEIVKPEQIIFKNTEISNFINDLQARLHNLDMVAKRLAGENKFLKRNMNTSLKNTISIVLKMRHLPLNELSRFTGINENELLIILDEMTKDNKVKKRGGRLRPG